MTLTTARNVLVAIQMLTMVGLVVMFWKTGAIRLSLAQFCYVIATGFLFIGVKA